MIILKYYFLIILFENEMSKFESFNDARKLKECFLDVLDDQRRNERRHYRRNVGSA